MTTLELLQFQNEHKDNFFGKGEDATEEQAINHMSDIYIVDKTK